MAKEKESEDHRGEHTGKQGDPLRDKIIEDED